MIPAAVAIMLRDGAEGLEALFIHRAERAGDVWSGQIAFPGGRRDPGDADLESTAIRETREEVGIDLAGPATQRLGTLDDLHPRTPVLPPVVVRPFVFGLTGPAPPMVPSPEVQAAFWIPLQALRAPGARREIVVHHPGMPPRAVPAYVIGSRTIWGMSERILTPLLELFSQPT